MSATAASGVQVSVSSSMSQDVVATAEVLVDSTSAAPVAAFRNPNAGGVQGNAQMEALCIADLAEQGSSGPGLCHVARDPQSAGGWRLAPLFGGHAAEQTAAGTAYPNSEEAAVYGFFQHGNGTYSTRLGGDGVSWTEPAKIQDAEAVANLRVAYAPDGLMLLHGSTPSGDLFTAWQEQVGGPFVSVVCDMGGGLASGDYALCLVDQRNWQLAANVNGKPVIYTGLVGAKEAASSGPAPQYDGTLSQVVLGYWSDTQGTLIYLFVDQDGKLHVWASNADNSSVVAEAIPNSKVTSATGHVDLNGNLHVYSIDDRDNLWVLHQSPGFPWNFDGTPRWAPCIALDKGVSAVVADINPADAPSLFALDAATYALRLHAQDPGSRMWHTGPVLQASKRVYELVRFRTEVSLIDGRGLPLANYPLDLRVADGGSACEIAMGPKSHLVEAKSDLTLSTNALGKLSFSVLTTQGMVAPNLELRAEGLDTPATISPAGPVHTYLSGTGTLNPTDPRGERKVFDADGSTLASAQVDGGNLAPKAKADADLAKSAASAIRNTAQVGMNTASGGFYALHLAEEGGSWCRDLTEGEDPEALFIELFGAAEGELGGVWDDITQFASDVWQGIKNGLIKIKDALVDVGQKIAHFTVQIGDWIAKGVKLAIKGIEQAAHFIAGVFEAVAAAIEKVIEWLKAMFDFGAIWRTKMAFEEGLNAAPPYIRELLGESSRAADGWFKEQRNEVTKAFDALEEKYAGQSFDKQPYWQSIDHGPSHEKMFGNASPADFSNNGHHNWLQAKVAAHAPSSSGVTPSGDLGQAWETFMGQSEQAMGDFANAIDDLGVAMKSLIDDPKSLASTAVPAFLDMLEQLVVGLLDLIDAVLDMLVALADTAMVGLDKLLTTELNLGFINDLWQWLAERAGYKDDAKLTASALISLIAAFPVTVIYKLIEGVDQEPFPDGHFPMLPGQAMVPGSEPPRNCLIASGALLVLVAIPALMAIGLGPEETPWWMTLITVGMSITAWALGNGYPVVSDLNWAGVAAVAGNLIWMLPCLYFVLKSLSAEDIDKLRADWRDRIAGLSTAYGVGMIVLGIVQSATTESSEDQVVRRILYPVPSAVSFLGMSGVRNDLTAIAQFMLSMFGYLIGGSAALAVGLNADSAENPHSGSPARPTTA